MKQAFIFKAGIYGTLVIETEKDLDRDKINEIREQISICEDGKGNLCHLNEGEEGSAMYTDGEYKDVIFTFNANAIYPTKWIENLFKILYLIITLS